MKYRFLELGEILQAGDQVSNEHPKDCNDGKWFDISDLCVGDGVMISKVFRRKKRKQDKRFFKVKATKDYTTFKSNMTEAERRIAMKEIAVGIKNLLKD